MIIKKMGYEHYKISDMIKGYLVTRVYLYHKRKDCIKMFNEEFKENGK